MTEIDIQNSIRVELSKLGVVFRMNTGVFLSEDGRRIKCGSPGMSDLLFIGNGFIAWIEVKKPGGRASQKQLNFIKKMKMRGHKAGIAHSVEEALKIINE